MEILYGAPLRGALLEKAKQFIRTLDLSWDEEVQSSFLLMQQGEILAAGSRMFNVLKCIGVSPSHRGEGLAATLLSLLSRDAAENGYSHLFLYTKPSNLPLFKELGFYEILSTEDAAILENRRDGIGRFVSGIPAFGGCGTMGCVVANADPFTKGHLFLAEQAAKECDHLYVFILSEERSFFPAESRLAMANSALAHLPEVTVVPSGGYLVSSATFPEYYIKDKARAKEINCRLDLELFTRHFAIPLHIGCRFVGTEPFCEVTRQYNEQMKQILPEYGLSVREIERFREGGRAVSASEVRHLLREGRTAEARALVPETTWDFLKEAQRNGT